MKVKEYITQLRKESVHRLGLLLKAEQELDSEVSNSANGFFDPKFMIARNEAEKAYLNAVADFNGFLSFCMKQGLKPDTELSFPESKN